MKMEYEKIIPNYFLLGIYIFLAIFGTILTILLYHRWKFRKVLTAKLLYLTFFSFLVSIFNVLTGYLSAVIQGYKKLLYIVTFGFGYCFSMVSIYFLLLFAEEIFGFDHKKFRIHRIFALILAVILVLPNNYYGVIDEEQGYFGPSIRLISSSLTLLYCFFIYTRLGYLAYQSSKKVDSHYAKIGFRAIALSQISMVFVYFFMLLDVIIFTLNTESLGYSPYVLIAWVFAGLFLFFTYLGYVYPGFLRKREMFRNFERIYAKQNEENDIEEDIDDKNKEFITSVKIKCPVCNEIVVLSNLSELIEKRDKFGGGIMNVAVQNSDPCGHNFVVYIDKFMKIRGSDILDYLSPS